MKIKTLSEFICQTLQAGIINFIGGGRSHKVGAIYQKSVIDPLNDLQNPLIGLLGVILELPAQGDDFLPIEGLPAGTRSATLLGKILVALIRVLLLQVIDQGLSQ